MQRKLIFQSCPIIYCIILYYIILYYIILYCIILYYIILYRHLPGRDKVLIILVIKLLLAMITYKIGQLLSNI